MLEGFHRPADPREALRLRSSLPGSTYLAGGPQINSAKDIPYRHLISLANIDLDIIQRISDSLFMGSVVTLQQIVEAEEFREGPWSVIRQAALHVANRNIRNQATLGGNLAANKSCSDLIPLLLVLEATCQIQEEHDTRDITLEEFQAFPPGEKPLLASVKVKRPPAGLVTALRRFSRTANDIAVVNVALAARAHDGRLEDVRVALGGLAPSVVRAGLVEKALEGFPAAASIESFAEKTSAALLGSIAPISDVRGSGAFKTRVAGALLLEALREISSPGGGN